MDAAALPTSHAQMDWFYRRSGNDDALAFMLNSAGMSPDCVVSRAERESRRGRRDGGGIRPCWLASRTLVCAWGEERRLGRSAESARRRRIAEGKLLERAQAPDIEQQIRATTAEFHQLR
jgi:hypothetical protein